MNKFTKFKKNVDSNAIALLSKKELEFITGGNGLGFDNAAGSQTSGTAHHPKPCDNTCVCTCHPIPDPKDPKTPKG